MEEKVARMSVPFSTMEGPATLCCPNMFLELCLFQVSANTISCLPQTLLKLSDVRSCHPAVEVFSVALQMDGTMVKAGLRWDSNLGFAVGCKDPLTYQDLKEKDFILDGDFLKRHLVSEVDVCVLVSLDSNVCLSLGYILQSASGKSGPEIIQKYSEVIKTVSKCEACVKAKAPHLNI